MDNFFRYADLTGDGTGATDAAVNGAITPQVFKLQPRTGEKALLVHRLIINVIDFGTFDSGSYGNAISLTNGVDIKVHNASDDAVLVDLLDGNPIITNVDWGGVCYDIALSTFGTGNERLGARWTFEKSGAPLRITETMYLAVTINDDMTGLIKQTFMFQGMISSD